MEYTYYLLNRPPMPGAYPTDNLINVVDEYNDRWVIDGRRTFGYVTYRKSLTRKLIDAYELIEWPLLVFEQNMTADWLNVDKLRGENVRYEVNNFRDVLWQYEWYCDWREGFVTILDVQGKPDARKAEALRRGLDMLPEWSRWMIQFVLQGCPADRFDGMTPYEVIDECVRIEDSGEYRLLVD
ncbi:hypothetical protein BW14_06935 [Bifidobacterium sp. UTBIF-68]|uniref:defense against restriction DarA-related protein n=1 Tax=Bifidobacterium sp. UTBIF-68 TaxID=1465262 RepID=UPI001128EE14|nr:hypothetical protein [Bifidobacterium sp. UTBIF-68]TPF92892.1 hypothetical protein BW14_06935 [Bifidobacterium sp. UTBIF-68]